MTDDTQRVCAECGSPISDDYDSILFCDEFCCTDYLHEHDELPDEPVVKGPPWPDEMDVKAQLNALESMADSILEAAVGDEAREAGRTPREHYDRLGDEQDFEAVAADQSQRQLVDYQEAT